MALKEHFEREIQIMKKDLKNGDELIIEDFIDNIRDIINTFSEQGHSGGSAPYYASLLSNTIKKTLNFEPLSPIMGTDDEWSNEIDDDLFQNIRLSSLFKNNTQSKSNKKRKISNKPYFLDAIIWQGEDKYDTFTGQVEDIASWQYIKGFPFTPKRFYIDVYNEKYDENIHKNEHYSKDDDGNKYVTRIKDRTQLKEVEKYYDMLEQLKELNPKKYYKITRKQKIKKINENKNSK